MYREDTCTIKCKKGARASKQVIILIFRASPVSEKNVLPKVGFFFDTKFLLLSDTMRNRFGCNRQYFPRRSKRIYMYFLDPVWGLRELALEDRFKNSYNHVYICTDLLNVYVGGNPKETLQA